ncbi:MAG: hypothetical protein IJR68_05560 [Fretibacterium sp.]|nr:hypothetical protein [Fretibacterium sp.]
MKDRTDTTIEDEIDAIRWEIWNEVKDLSPAEKHVYYREQTAPLYERFNIKVSPLKPVPPFKREERLEFV